MSAMLGVLKSVLLHEPTRIGTWSGTLIEASQFEIEVADDFSLTVVTWKDPGGNTNHRVYDRHAVKEWNLVEPKLQDLEPVEPIAAAAPKGRKAS